MIKKNIKNLHDIYALNPKYPYFRLLGITPFMEHNHESVPSLFCIPDITGFTKLVATADIDFTSEMIPSILRKLINCNILNMHVAEIEGDAIFFYRPGRLPGINSVVKQCNLLYDAFTDYIRSLEKTDEENYKKHLADGQLGLKIIVHYGMISTSNIKGRTKLIGQDVIIAHKLLKNTIPDSEYILFTENYLKRVKLNHQTSLVNWKHLKKGVVVYDYIGEVKYRSIKIGKDTFIRKKSS